MKSIAEVESNLLGAYIENEDLFLGIEHLVADKLWSVAVNRTAFKLIKSLRAKGIKPDNVIIGKELRNKGIPDPPKYTTTNLYKFQPQEYVLFLFEENRIKKHILPSAEEAVHKMKAGTASPLDVMLDLKEKINDVELVINNVSKESDIKDVVAKAIQEIREAKESKKKMGYSTGIMKLDEITGGLLPGIVVVGAPPGAGKTTLIVNIIQKIAVDSDAPIVFFSLEMPATQIIKNLLSNKLEISTNSVRDGNIDDDQMLSLEEAAKRIKNNLDIDDTPGITWQYMDAKLTRARKKIPKEKQMVVMVDYLQLMNNLEEEKKGRTDEAIMALRTKGLMNMWKKHNACIIELSQLGREVVKEKRRPRMSDLKESGSIEANANVVLLLHRPDYYEENPTDARGNSLKGIMEIIVDKNRGGRRGYVYTNFLGKYSKLTDFNKEEFERGGII